MASLPPRPESPLRMPARDDRRHPPDDRDRLIDRRPMRPSRFSDRPPPADRLYTPSRPRPDTYVAPPYDRRRDYERDRDRSRERRRDRSRDYDRDRDRSPRRRSPDRDFRGFRGPPQRRRFSPPPPGRGGRPYRRDSRSPPRRRVSRSPPPYRGRPRSRTRSRSPPSPRRPRLGNHPFARSPRSRSPYKRGPSIDRSLSPTKRPIERRPNSPKEPGEHDEEMPSPKRTTPEAARTEATPLSLPSAPDVPLPPKEEPMEFALSQPLQQPDAMNEPRRRMSPPPPNEMDIIVGSDGIQHPVSNERSSPITPPIQVKIERMKAEAAPPESYNRRTSDSTARIADTRIKTEADDHKANLKVEMKYEQLPYAISPKVEVKALEDSSHGMDSPRAPTVASSQAHRSPSPKASPIAPSPVASLPMAANSRPLPTGPSRGWGGRSPPRGPRSHIQRTNAAPMASPITNHNGPHSFTPRGPRRGGFQSGAPYSSAPSHFANRKKNICDPKSHEPTQSLEIDAEVSKLTQAYPKLQVAAEVSSRAVYRALQELDMANIDLNAAESRRLVAEQQLEKAKSGLLGIDALSFPASPAS
ncbi:hypothetical protein D9619_005850 [Psilocybe cf. subviscida]|uniref:Uncharacterized protein n=1 Tax=Psilocybe cf. subviscida TaxID=2480587 RepID=A0A8H5BXM9_9AGAR|nr:hypothetical protein D9619_005850 [Psilocybe cf. subviscida]